MDARPEPSARRVVIFDGACGFCTWAVSHAWRWTRGSGYTFVPFQLLTPADFDRFGLTKDVAAHAVQVVTDGVTRSGADGVNALLESIPPVAPAVRLFARIPFALPLERAVYRSVATNRVAISAVLRTAHYAIFEHDD